MITLNFGKHKYGPIAENHKELTAKQKKKIDAIMLISEDELLIKMKVLHVLLNMSLFRFFMIPIDAKNRMLPYVDWLFENKTKVG